MVGRCSSCQAPVAEGLEVCEVCRTTQIPKLNLDSVSGPSKAVLGNPMHLSRFEARFDDHDDAPFCGRGAELGKLAALAERALVQQKLHVALVHGAPGSGKTRLLRELGRVITNHLGLPRDRILVGTMPGEAASATSALLAQLRTRCDVQAAEPPQSAREKILRTCRALLPAVRAAEVAHCLGELLGIPFPEGHLFTTSLPVGMTANEGERPAGEPRTYVALKRFLIADAKRSPLILLFDEMEHATDETMSLLHYLVESLTELPVFVGIFARPEFLEKNADCGSSTVGVTRIELPPMPTVELVELFCTAVATEPEAVPPELLQKVEANGDGSPRKVVELYQLLREFEVIIPDRAHHDLDDGHPAFAWDLERLAQLDLPDKLSMESLIAARVAAMPDTQRLLLEKAALCGEHFYLDALLMLQRCGQAGLGITDEEGADGSGAPADPEAPAADDLFAPGDRAAMHETLTQLMQKGLVRWVRDSRLRGEREYRFAYPPWRDIVYQSLPPQQRRRDHRLLAHWLLLHRERDNEELLESVARHMERAGRGAAAAMFYRRVAELAAARNVYSKPPRLLLRALSCLGSADVAMRVGLWADLGAALVQKGDFDAAFGAYEKLLRLAHALAVRHYLAQAHYALGQLTLHKGEPSQALEHLTRAFDEYTELADSQGVSDSLDDLGQVLWRLGRTEEALDRAGRALELRRRLGDRRKVATSLLHIGAIEQHRGLVDPAVSCYEEALRKHDGDPQLLAACLEALGSIELLRGARQEARARFEQGLSLVEPLGPSPLVAILMCRLGEALLQEGLLDEAERRLSAARELAFRLSDRRALAEIERLLGLLLLQRGQHKAALDSCQKALDQAQRNGMRHEIARSLLALGQVHAVTLFDETVEGAHPAWDCFRRSVTLLREVGDQAELAVALYQLGRHLIERGRVGPARNTLREAEQIASKLRMQQANEMRQMLAEL